MQNKTLQALLEATAANAENPAELENLGQELAEKLRGGQGQADSPLNVSCPIINNTGCPAS